ncbi:uncharacterized protein [Diadema setosum]|uniref:uncharacterized protein n=1 Tax=Diadema setosum TaxID=31175 RepID=UPI003B3AF72D
MDSSMDVLPFSLSCDRCNFRTKSMTAMREHAASHVGHPHPEDGDASDAGISGNVPGENDALQALVDSALRDASGLLLGSHGENHSRVAMATTSRGMVEEVGRADGGSSDRLEGRLQHQSRIDGVHMQSHEASGLVDEDLLRMYAAEIDLSVVGGGGEEGGGGDGGGEGSDAVEGQFGRGCSRVERDGDIGAGVIPGIGNLLVVQGDQRGCEIRRGNRGINPCEAVGEGKLYRVPCSEDSAQNQHPHPSINSTTNVIESAHVHEDGRISERQKSESEESATRPQVKFVIHPSAFSKSSPPVLNSPVSTSKDLPVVAKESHPHPSAVAKATGTRTPISDGVAKPAKKLESVASALRTRGQRARPTTTVSEEPEMDGDFLPGRRRGRKPACPIKVVLQPTQRRPRAKRGGRGGRTPARQSRDEGKKTLQKCSQCSFTCVFKKDLTAHVKSSHAKKAQLGKVSFEISGRKTRQLRNKEDTGKRGRPRKARDAPPRLDRKEQIEAKPRKRGRPRTKTNESVSNESKPKLDEDAQNKKVREGGKSTRSCRARKKSTSVDLQDYAVGNDVQAIMSSEEENQEEEEDEEEHDITNKADGDDSVCDICENFVADSPADMKHHKASVHGGASKTSSKQFKCNFCDYSCQFRKTLATHIHSSHNEEEQAKLQELNSLPKLQRPKAPTVADSSRVYRCNLCDFSCHASHLLNSHMKSQHNFEKMSGEFKCDVCGKVVVGRYSHFRRHLRTHTDERPYKCDECPLAFRDINSLNCHKPIHKEERDYLCEECGMAFKRPINLRMHRKVHTDKSFSCDECDYKCRRRNTLINHKKRKHLKQKTVLCQHCGHRFFSKTECKNHVLKKHTVRPTPFACPVCPQVFMFQYRFKAHLKTHKEIKPYKCSYCGFKTRLNTYLMDHLRQHTGEKPKKCNQCDYTTSTNSNLYKHRKRHHGPASTSPGRNQRLRKSRCKISGKDDEGTTADATGDAGSSGPGNHTPQAQQEKNVVEEIVNAVDFAQLPSQVITSSSIFSMPTMCSSTQELKQEQLMQVPPVDVHHGLPLMAGEVSIISSSISEASHHHGDADKTSSSVAAMMEALAEARNMRQPSAPPPPPPVQPSHQHTISHHNPYPVHLVPAPQATAVGSVNTTATNPGGGGGILPRATTNMTMHYSHPNIGTIGAAAHYHHLSALAGEAAARSPITSHAPQQPVHNTAIPPPLLGVGQVSATPPSLGHFPNMMHF